MSRHWVKATLPWFRVYVGWDPGLHTFFGQAYRNEHEDEEEDEGPLKWVGTSYAEILDPETLGRLMQPFLVLDAATLALLRADRDADR